MSSQGLNGIFRKCWRMSFRHSKGTNFHKNMTTNVQTKSLHTVCNRCIRRLSAVNVNDNRKRWGNLQQLINCGVKGRGLHTEINHDGLQNDITFIDSSDESVQQTMIKDMIIIGDFVTEEEEQRLIDEVEPYLNRMRYESSHWDDAIHSYRETERKHWREVNKPIIQRIRDTAFPEHVQQLSLVHVLDLNKDGYIKPHVDAVRFCGNTIAGISLLSSAVMRLVHTDDPEKYADILLKQRSIYIMKDEARYKYTHEVLKSEESFFKGEPVSRDRRVAVICRNEPK